MEHLKIFSERFQDLLADNDISIKHLSQLTGINQSRLYDFSNKLHIPSLSNALKISDAFQCPLDYLFGFCDDFQPTKFDVVDTVANRIKSAIDESALTRYQLSKLSEINQSQLFRWYHGIETPTLVSLVSLVEYLNCSLDFLAGREN